MIGSFGSTGFAQNAKPELLLTPEDWRFERMDLPFDFAADIDFEGFEELRFAPGMFDTLSETYFTYIFAVSINNDVSINKSEIYNFLNKYYKGLCAAVAESKNMQVDTSKIEIEITKVTTSITTYHSKILFFDVFTNGQEVLLNMEIEIIPKDDGNGSYMLALVSPQAKDIEVWDALKKIKSRTRLK